MIAYGVWEQGHEDRVLLGLYRTRAAAEAHLDAITARDFVYVEEREVLDEFRGVDVLDFAKAGEK